ncbi:MAG: hypothetical protein AB7S26_00155 [Sandaracinaceae bacterium]
MVERDAASVDAAVDPPGPDAGALGRPERCNGIDDDLDGKRDEGCPIRITDDPRQDVYPSLSGSRVAWTRQPFERMGYVGELWVQDLPDGEPRLVEEEAALASLSGDRVAFLQGDTYVVVDLVTDARTVIEPESVHYAQRPSLDGEVLVWSQLMEGSVEDFEVFAHDLGTATTHRIGRDPNVQQFPRVEDGRIVWQDDRLGHHTIGQLHLFDLYVADDLSGNARRLTLRDPDTTIGGVVALDRGRALVTEHFGDVTDVASPQPCAPVIYDVDTAVRTELLERTLECYTARDLSGRWAVFEYDAEGISDLYLLDLDSGVLRQVTRHRRYSTRAHVDGDVLVWQDDRNDHWDLYFMDLSDVDDGDFFPEGVAP